MTSSVRDLLLAALLLSACPSTPPGGNGGDGGGGVVIVPRCTADTIGARCGANKQCTTDGRCVDCPSLGTSCAEAEACEVVEITCVSGAPVCARVRFRDEGFTCRGASSSCDVAERCDGAAPGCPADVLAPDGTRCNDELFCNGADTCAGGACSRHEGMTCSGTLLCREADDSCVECLTATDCSARIDNSAQCLQLACSTAGSCQATALHDSASWRVAPVPGPELDVAALGDVNDALFDGLNYLVTYTVAARPWARRVGANGRLLDPDPIALDARAQALAFAGDRYLVVSVEPPAGVAPYDYIAGYYMSRDGQQISQKFPLIIDFGSNCGGSPADLVAPSVAGSGTAFAVYAQVACGFLIRGALVSGMTSSPLPSIGGADLRSPRSPNVFARDGGFAMVTSDLFVGGGRNEAYALEVNAAGGNLSGYQVLTPAVGPGSVVSNYTLQWGNNQWLYAVDHSGTTYELRNGLLNQRLFPPTALGASYQANGPTPMETGFDGTNYLVITTGLTSPTGVKGKRITDTGVVLDPTNFQLTPADAGTALPKLVGNGSGRYLVAYNRASGGVGARFFSTCP